MIKSKLLITFALFVVSIASAQKIGVVDTNYILDKLPQYREAENRLDQQVKTWETEIQDLQKQYDAKKLALENERVLLVGDQLKVREKEVDELDKKIKTLINTRFGTKGEISGARASLTKPFQDQIWNAIQQVVTKNGLGIVLDKSNNISVLFLDNRYDYTDKVLDVLLGNTTNSQKTGTSQNKRK